MAGLAPCQDCGEPLDNCRPGKRGPAPQRCTACAAERRRMKNRESAAESYRRHKPGRRGASLARKREASPHAGQGGPRHPGIQLPW